MAEDRESIIVSEAKLAEGYDREDAGSQKVIGLTIITIATLVVLIILVFEYFNASKESRIYSAVAKPEAISLREVRAREAEILGSYKAVDSKKGVYRIPVGRAMELVAEEARTGKKQFLMPEVAMPVAADSTQSDSTKSAAKPAKPAKAKKPSKKSAADK